MNRRRRAPIACILCRNRKIKCDRGIPCSNCLRSRNGTCVYESQPSHSSRQHPGCDNPTENEAGQVSRQIQYPTPVSTGASHPSSTWVANSVNATTIESMESKIRKLEAQLSRATQKPTQSPARTSDSNVGTTPSRLNETFSIYKSRMYGQSHWYNGGVLFQGLFEIIEPHLGEETSKAFSGLQRCKSLSKVVKSQRTPHWPPLKSDLPSKDVADELVDCYLRTTEAVYRILHIPSFIRDYDTIWLSGTEPDAAFIVQLKLVLAIGSVTYDENFSLRTSAIHWIYEAQNWLSKPEFKSRLNIQFLQTNLLLLIAREAINVGGELIWISAGSLFRTAVYMGLHRDPVHLSKRTTFAIEMRRRLWNTILEMTLQSSIVAGGSPFMSLDDFDTQPPRNFDDDQLLNEDPMPKEGDFTQVSVAIALRETFSLRLKIVKFLNDLGSRRTYEETLRLDTDLRVSYKTLRRTLQGFKLNNSQPQFEVRVCDLLMNHYLSSLHMPYLGLALHETAYAYSRKVVNEASLRIWFAVSPSTITESSTRDDLARFAICDSGIFRIIAFQASLMIAVELRTQILEEEIIGPIPLRPDLFAILDDAKAWFLRCIKAGETNIKGYLFMNVIEAHLKGLMLSPALGKDEMAGLLIKAAEDAEETCLKLLEDMAGGDPTDGSQDQDFMTSDVLFDLGNMDPMSWLFNDGATPEPSSLW